MLTTTARDAIQNAEAVALSPISIYEITYAHQRGRVGLGLPLDEWLAVSLGAGITVLPVTQDIAMLAGGLDWKHGDPADRLIVATANIHGTPLITTDKRIHESELVEVVW